MHFVPSSLTKSLPAIMALLIIMAKKNAGAALPIAKASSDKFWQSANQKLSINSIIFLLVDPSGKGPKPAFILSSACCGLDVAGMTQVTAGFEIMNLRKNWLQVSILYSFVHVGRILVLTLLNNLPSPKGLLIKIAVPCSLATRNKFFSAWRSSIE